MHENNCFSKATNYGFSHTNYLAKGIARKYMAPMTLMIPIQWRSLGGTIDGGWTNFSPETLLFISGSFLCRVSSFPPWLITFIRCFFRRHSTFPTLWKTIFIPYASLEAI